MPHELFLTTRQTIKIRNYFANNMSTDTKLSKAQMFKKLKSSKSFGSWLCNLGKISLTNIAIPLAKDNLPLLVINLLVRNKYTLKKNKWERSCESKTFV